MSVESKLSSPYEVRTLISSPTSSSLATSAGALGYRALAARPGLQATRGSAARDLQAGWC